LLTGWNKSRTTGVTLLEIWDGSDERLEMDCVDLPRLRQGDTAHGRTAGCA
jgi:hypothetical protein